MRAGKKAQVLTWFWLQMFTADGFMPLMSFAHDHSGWIFSLRLVLIRQFSRNGNTRLQEMFHKAESKVSRYVCTVYTLCKYIHCRRFVGCVNQTESQATWSKFHGESYDNLFIFTTVATQWHIWLEFWFIYLNVCCCIRKACIQVRTLDGVNWPVLDSLLSSD
jgi:hypothetical protein